MIQAWISIQTHKSRSGSKHSSTHQIIGEHTVSLHLTFGSRSMPRSWKVQRLTSLLQHRHLLSNSDSSTREAASKSLFAWLIARSVTQIIHRGEPMLLSPYPTFTHVHVKLQIFFYFIVLLHQNKRTEQKMDVTPALSTSFIESP